MYPTFCRTTVQVAEPRWPSGNTLAFKAEIYSSSRLTADRISGFQFALNVAFRIARMYQINYQVTLLAFQRLLGLLEYNQWLKSLLQTRLLLKIWEFYFLIVLTVALVHSGEKRESLLRFQHHYCTQRLSLRWSGPRVSPTCSSTRL
jgi:hypothetical protein